METVTQALGENLQDVVAAFIESTASLSEGAYNDSAALVAAILKQTKRYEGDTIGHVYAEQAMVRDAIKTTQMWLDDYGDGLFSEAQEEVLHTALKDFKSYNHTLYQYAEHLLSLEESQTTEGGDHEHEYTSAPDSN